MFAVILVETSEETMVATWDAYRVRVFCDICMEEVNNNNRDGGCLSKKGYENLERKFYEKVGEKLVKKQFKNKWVYNNALNTLVSRNEGSSSTKADKVPTMKEF